MDLKKTVNDKLLEFPAIEPLEKKPSDGQENTKAINLFSLRKI